MQEENTNWNIVIKDSTTFFIVYNIYPSLIFNNFKESLGKATKKIMGKIYPEDNEITFSNKEEKVKTEVSENFMKKISKDLKSGNAAMLKKGISALIVGLSITTSSLHASDINHQGSKIINNLTAQVSSKINSISPNDFKTKQVAKDMIKNITIVDNSEVEQMIDKSGFKIKFLSNSKVAPEVKSILTDLSKKAILSNLERWSKISGQGIIDPKTGKLTP